MDAPNRQRFRVSNENLVSESNPAAFNHHVWRILPQCYETETGFCVHRECGFPTAEMRQEFLTLRLRNCQVPASIRCHRSRIMSLSCNMDMHRLWIMAIPFICTTHPCYQVPSLIHGFPQEGPGGWACSDQDPRWHRPRRLAGQWGLLVTGQAKGQGHRKGPL